MVDQYTDQAVGLMNKNESGRMAMTKVTLNPRVVYAAGKRPSVEEEEAIHHRAHDLCFIANSVKTEIETVVHPDQVPA